MRKWIWIIMVILFMPQAYAAADTNDNPATSANDGKYLLHAGDMISINVYGYPELNFPSEEQGQGLTIRMDGKITYPFLGEINAEGISAKELAQRITDQLGKAYVNPRVGVNIMRFGTDRIYVLGEVNRPSSYELAKSRTLLDAIAAASGWTTNAAKTKVFLIRKDQRGKPPIKVNLLTLIEKGDTSINHALQRGDIVYLTGSNRIDFAQDIVPMINAVSMLQQMQEIKRENNNEKTTDKPYENPCP